jgi:hypothetical protein
MIFSATHDNHVCASREETVLAEGIILVNEYRTATGLQIMKLTDL